MIPPMPIYAFVLRKFISSAFFIVSAVVVYILKDKFERKYYEKKFK